MRIMLVGFGVVGRAFLELLEAQRGYLYERTGLSPRVVGVLDSGGAAVGEHGLDAQQLLETKEAHGTVAALPRHGVAGLGAEELILGSHADVLIESTPSNIDDPSRALDHLRAAFRSGKHAITVNKAPLAVAMPGLLELARYNGTELRFSGTVGAGTPFLNWALECARGDEILNIRAILNGTTNYILSRMRDEGVPFDDVLADAQRLGYAEADPSADVDGIDSAVKVVIIANRVLERTCTIDDLTVEGIRGVTPERVADAKSRGMSIKLIGEASDEGPLSVTPTEVPTGSPLDVPDALNAATLTLRRAGEVTLVGRGAGGVETATGVMRDLLDIWQTTEVSA